MLPKVRFELADPKFDADLLFAFCKLQKTGWDWSDRIFQAHPELRKKLTGL